MQIVAHFLPHFGATRLDEITKSDVVRYGRAGLGRFALKRRKPRETAESRN